MKSLNIVLKQLRVQEEECKWIPYIYAILGHFFITLTWSIFKYLSDNGFDSNQILYFRGLIVFFINYAVISYFKHEMYPSDKSAQRTLLARFFIQMLSPLLQFYAISQLYVSDATVLALTNPIWVQLSSALIYGEPIKRQNLMYTLVSFVGIIFVSRPHFVFKHFESAIDIPAEKEAADKNRLLGCGAMLLGAILLAISQSLFKGLQGKTSNTVAMQYFYLSNLLSTPFGLIQAENADTRVLTEPKYLLVVLLIAVLAFLGQSLQSRSLFMENPSKLSPLSYSRIVYAFLIDVIVFRIEVQTLSLIGFALILLSLFHIVKSK